MRNTDYFKNKRITIVGLARSGLACANLLYDLGARVSVTDNQDNDFVRSSAAKLKSKDIKSELGKHSPEFIKDRDLIVTSPGITDEAPPLIWAGDFKIPVISEVEVGGILCPGTVIAVTGTNGKTTVTTLIGQILEAADKKCFVCGNIGNPFCAEVPKIEATDYVSLEISSFQLEKIQAFKPKIALILNFSHNHLNRYKNIQEYLAAKKRIFMNQDKSDYLILNSQDPLVKSLAGEAKAQAIYFSKDEDLNPNQTAVLAAGSVLGIDKKLILDVFKKFKGIEHRLEYVTQINNIKFINDSKATTVDATLWALKNILEPIVLIAGGRDKGSDYTLLQDSLHNKVKEIVLIGEARKKIRHALGEAFSFDEAASLEEAVDKAFSKARAGDYVLLSPMCSSFDMFSNYEERGNAFKKAVYALVKDKS